MSLKVGVSSGIYYAARDVELHNTIRKVGYTLTRGTATMEIAVDVAHEVTFTEGNQIRKISKKQDIRLNMHGDLQVPLCIPERGEWRDAHDRLIKSMRSAVFLGAHYVNFHACLNIWLELITYAGRKLSASFVDGEGKFIAHMLKENEKTREWFVMNKYEEYYSDLFTPDERTEIDSDISQRIERWLKEKQTVEFRKIGLPDNMIERVMSTGSAFGRDAEEERKVRGILDSINAERRQKGSLIQREAIQDAFRKKLKKGGRWHREELRQVLGLVDGYHIMAHYLFFTQDPLWVAMANEYNDVLSRYNYSTSDPDWLSNAWRKAEDDNDRGYKEFFYAAVGAKYLEGHIKSAFKWLHNDFIKKEIPKVAKTAQEREELTKIAKNLIIGIEIPDARETQHAGLYYLFRPKQLYATIKTARKTLNTNKLMMVMDFEHLATQGYDALLESRNDILKKSDFGALTIACHSNHPNPLQPHQPIEIGDVILYELLYNLRVTGFGKGQPGYLVFERGGGQDPFAHSVDALRLIAEFLEKEPPTLPKELPLEFFGMKGLTGGDIQRQAQIVRDHAFEPMKDLLEIPEEEWTMISQTAIKKGKRPEVWKRGEFR